MVWSIRILLYQDGHLDKADSVESVASARLAHEIFVQAVIAANGYYKKNAVTTTEDKKCTQQ